MQRKSLTLALAIASTVGLAAAVPSFAQDTGGSTNSKTGAAAAAQTGSTNQMGAGTQSTRTDWTGSSGMTTRHADPATVRSGQSFDKTDRDTWAETYAGQNKGRISRQAYLNEMSRRWDAIDQNQQGLTPAEVSRLYGNVDSAAGPARTGSGVQAGNMGPGNQKAQ